MWAIAFGIGLLLIGLLVTVVVCARMNDPAPPHASPARPRVRDSAARSKLDPA